MKSYILKLANILILYIVQHEYSSTNAVTGGCSLRSVGSQFFWLILSDFTVGNIIEVAYPAYLVRARA